MILEEIAAGDGGTSTVVSVNNCPVCSILMAWANDAQKEQWLKPLARGEMLGAFCLTEPHVGSQADGLKTTRGDSDGDDYVLNGVKQFITSGKNGDVAIVMAVTDKAAGKKGISAFIVPTATPGYSVARHRRQAGPAQQRHRADPVRELPRAGREPDRRRRPGPEDRAVGPGGRAHRHRRAKRGHGARRVRGGAGATRRSAIAFGKPIFEHQAVQFRLADMATQIEAARQLIHHAASAEGRRPCPA